MPTLVRKSQESSFAAKAIKIYNITNENAPFLLQVPMAHPNNNEDEGGEEGDQDIDDEEGVIEHSINASSLTAGAKHKLPGQFESKD